MSVETTSEIASNGGAHGAPAVGLQRLVSRWPDWKKEKHKKYMAEWRKDPANHAAQLESSRKSFKRFGKLRHKKYVATHSAAATTVRSRESEKKATMARQPWGVVEDTMLVSGMTEGELVLALGRSIRAIQRRRWKLRDDEAANEKAQAQPPTATPERKGKEQI